MSHSWNKVAQWLTYAIAILAFTATCGGILIPTLYRDPPVIKTVWLGNDIVTFLVAPLFMLAFHAATFLCFHKRGRADPAVTLVK